MWTLDIKVLLKLTPTIDLELELDLDLDLGLDLGLDLDLDLDLYLNKLLDTEEMMILLKGYNLGSINVLSLSDSAVNLAVLTSFEWMNSRASEIENSDIHLEFLAIIKKLL